MFSVLVLFLGCTVMSDIVSDDEGISGQSMCNNIILKLHQFQKKNKNLIETIKELKKIYFLGCKKHTHTHTKLNEEIA